MKALAHDRYGPPADVLSIEVAEVPIAAADEVLVRVHAASIHIGDCHGVMGVPYPGSTDGPPEAVLDVLIRGLRGGRRGPRAR